MNGELGVPLADRQAESLGLPGNPCLLSAYKSANPKWPILRSMLVSSMQFMEGK